jgi:hypothetical protein
VVTARNDQQMRRELNQLLASAHTDKLDPSELAERLQSLHDRFLGAAANRPDMIKRRHDAAKAYANLIAGIDIERHHNHELLTQALELNPKRNPGM